MLHKTKYMLGFHVEATDGGIGHVDDFLVDQTWNVRYLVVDTSNWIGGDSVLVPSTAIDRVDPPHKKIYVKLTRVETAAYGSRENRPRRDDRATRRMLEKWR
jgi:hypothetical protein